MEVGLNPIDTDDGRMVLSAIVDRTKLVNQQEGLEARTRELERSNRELERFAYVASHDLREPLRMVSSYTSLLGKRFKGQLGDKADRHIDYAVDGAQRMQRMLDDLLELSRVGKATKLVPVALEDAVHEALRSLGNPELGTLHIGDLPIVAGDMTQLARVFQNLIGNAIKYRRDIPVELSIEAERSGAEWHVTVADNGIGFDQEYAERDVPALARTRKVRRKRDRTLDRC